MATRLCGRITPNKRGMQLYFGARFTNSSVNPLTPDETYVAIARDDGLFVFDAGRVPDFPVTIRSPTAAEPFDNQRDTILTDTPFHE